MLAPWSSDFNQNCVFSQLSHLHNLECLTDVMAAEEEDGFHMPASEVVALLSQQERRVSWSPAPPRYQTQVCGSLVALHLLPIPPKAPLPTPGTEGSRILFLPLAPASLCCPFLQRRTSTLLRLSLTFYSHFRKKLDYWIYENNL